MIKVFLIVFLLLFSQVALCGLTSNQTTVIGNAMGSYYGTNSLSDLIKWAIAIIYLLWMAWMGLSSFSSWADGESSIADLSYSVVVAAAITMLVVWVIT